MPEAKRRRVLIAGGGIGGLALAVALARAGRDSLVLEARQTIAAEGAGIQIGPNGVRVLQALDVADALSPQVGVPDAIEVYRGATGRPLATLPLGAAIAKRHGAPYWVVHRADLHAALLQQAMRYRQIEIRTGFVVADARQETGYVNAVLESGEAIAGSVLVGADGLWSAVRGHVVPGVEPRFAGASASRVVLPREAAGKLAQTAVGLWLSPKAHVVHYPVRGGAEIAAVLIARENWQSRAWDEDGDRAHIRSHLAAFDPSLGGPLTAAPGWRRWSLNEMPELSQWTRGCVVLIGDAAHPMLPHLAQGGVLALEDALCLALALTRGAPDAGALVRFAKTRRPRARRVQAASRRNGWIYQLSGAMGQIRDGAFAVVPGHLLMSGLDWLYGWRT